MSYMQPNQTIVNSSGAGSYYALQANPSPHPATMLVEMPPYWRLRDGRLAKRVPRLQRFSPSQQSFPGITFSSDGWCGVRVKDILRNRASIDCPTDLVFAHHGWRATNLSLEWPGYIAGSSDASRCRLYTHVGNNPMTREQFALRIAELIQDLYNRACDKPVRVGYEDWAFSENKVRLSDVYILSAHYYRNVWVPELYVINME
ncbi:hypothetical protein BDR07DRAFT_234845 [Suillus spraguei]|nr:hypothetical protein BDR07DRAFT_234845 [Suillus spraguei]